MLVVPQIGLLQCIMMWYLVKVLLQKCNFSEHREVLHCNMLNGLHIVFDVLILCRWIGQLCGTVSDPKN